MTLRPGSGQALRPGSGQVGQAPRIGISTSDGGAIRPAAKWYAAAIEAAGGHPVWIEPAARMAGGPEEVLRGIDALVLSGGKDVDPRYYHQATVDGASVEIDEQRDAVELPLARAALAMDLPLLGICRGIQVLNVAAGGSLHQDLSLIDIDPLTHKQPGGTWLMHPVQLSPTSRLAALLGGLLAEVNSSHHQAVHTLAPDVVVTARAPDGVIEGIEAPTRSFALGVQWHPERMVEHDDRQRRVFEALVEAARTRRSMVKRPPTRPCEAC